VGTISEDEMRKPEGFGSGLHNYHKDLFLDMKRQRQYTLDNYLMKAEGVFQYEA